MTESLMYRDEHISQVHDVSEVSTLLCAQIVFSDVQSGSKLRMRCTAVCDVAINDVSVFTLVKYSQDMSASCIGHRAII